MSAFIAKLCARCICISTLRAGEFQFIPALFAELGAFTTLKLAFWAFHFDTSCLCRRARLSATGKGSFEMGLGLVIEEIGTPGRTKS